MKHPFSRQNRIDFKSETERNHPNFSYRNTQKEYCGTKEKFFSWSRKIQSYFARKEAEVLCRVMRTQDSTRQEGMRDHLLNAKYSFHRFIFHRPQMKLIAALILIAGIFAIAQLFFTKNRIQSASYGWLQTDWSGGADLDAKAVHPAGQTGWTKYESAGSVDTANNELKLQRYTN